MGNVSGFSPVAHGQGYRAQVLDWVERLLGRIIFARAKEIHKSIRTLAQYGCLKRESRGQIQPPFRKLVQWHRSLVSNQWLGAAHPGRGAAVLPDRRLDAPAQPARCLVFHRRRRHQTVVPVLGSVSRLHHWMARKFWVSIHGRTHF